MFDVPIVSNSPVVALIVPTPDALSTKPRLVPAGANHGNATSSFNAITLSAMCDGGTTTLFPAKSLVNPDG